jgi:hypothetical protein
MMPIRMSTSDFVGLVGDVSRAATKDSDLPMLAGVLVHLDEHEGETVLVGTATNRFVLVQAHATVESGRWPRGTRVWLTAAQVKQLTQVFKPYATVTGRAPGQVEITTRGSVLKIQQLATGGQAGMTLSFPVCPGEQFPKVDRVLGPERERCADQFTVHPQWLKLLASLCRKNESLTVELSGSHSPMRATVGTPETARLCALVMPLAVTRACATPAVFHIPTTETAEKKELVA